MRQSIVCLIFCMCVTSIFCLPSSRVSIDDWAPVTDRKGLVPSSRPVTASAALKSAPTTQIKEPEIVETTSEQNLTEEGRRRNGFGNRHGNKKNSYSNLIVPIMILPAVIFSSFLPFLIPALKLAALFAAGINNAALMAGVLYLARQNALEQEQRQVLNFNPGYFVRRRNALVG